MTLSTKATDSPTPMMWYYLSGAGDGGAAVAETTGWSALVAAHPAYAPTGSARVIRDLERLPPTETKKEANRILAEQSKFELDTLGSSEIELRSPLILDVEFDGFITVSTPQFDVYGCGATIFEAVSEFRESLVELYFAFALEDDESLMSSARSLKYALSDALVYRPRELHGAEAN